MSLEHNYRRIVGIDYGRKYVGIAVADPLRTFSQPFGTFSPDVAVKELKKIHQTDGVDTLVIGWPLTLEGEEGYATEQVQLYINRLKNALGDIKVVRWDERFTSVAARAILKKNGVNLSYKKKGRVDATAAGIVLQEYLDEKEHDFQV